MPGYVNTFQSAVDTFQSAVDVEEDGDVDEATDDMLLLQSMLLVTYTAPRTMHLITKALRLLFSDHAGPADRQLALARVLRGHARDKVREAYFDAGEPTGFDIGRVVFTYLDYLLVTDDPRGRAGFRFAFRNSLEHFYPQCPHEEMHGSRVSEACLHLLGNLALVSVGANSKFSNSLPKAKAKAENYRQTIERQSYKLRLMAQITRQEGWGDEQVRRHHEKMVSRLERDLGQAPW